MAQRKTLTERQVAVLRWVADGCPDGVMDDEFHRISVAALRRRELVTTSGRGPTWAAEVTRAGLDYLTEVDGPRPPLLRQPSVSVTQQLVDDVVAGGGVLRVPVKRWYDREGVDYENRARLAERHGKVPAGKRLTTTTVGDELEVRLVDTPDHPGSRAVLVPVVVPQRVSRYHAAARAFRDRSDRHEVSRALLGRATRIVEAIAVEAERRGWSVHASSESPDGHGRTGWTGAKDGHLTIATNDYVFRLRLREQGVHPRGLWDEEIKRNRSWSSYGGRDVPTGPYDADATGRLELELDTARSWIYRGWQSRWGDRQSWKLEERLSHLFQGIEQRVAEAERVAEEERIAAEKAAMAARHEAEERERRWHELMAQARERLVEAQRATTLREQSDAWHQAERLRRYCDAMDAAHGDHAETVRWIAWARGYATRLDPLTEPPAMPDPPDPSPEALQPYLPDGWSAHGPEHRLGPRFDQHSRY